MTFELSPSSKIKLMTYISPDTFDVLSASADGANGPDAKYLANQLLSTFDLLSASAYGANGPDAEHLASVVLKHAH